MEKDLKEKAIEFKGKKYVLIADRVLYFNEEYPNGCIKTERLNNGDMMEVFKATVIPDTSVPERFFNGHSQATWGDGYINKTSAMENAETSAIGRALALMGIGVIESIASADEIKKATSQPEPKPKTNFNEELKAKLKELGIDTLGKAKDYLYKLDGNVYKAIPTDEKICSLLLTKIITKNGGNGNPQTV